MSKIERFAGKYDFLSNFPYALVYLDDIAYDSVEKGYQAAKTFNLDWRKKIQNCSSSCSAKRIGSQITKNGLLRPDWYDVNKSIMKELLIQKYAYPELQEKLLLTRGRILIEGNYWHDNFWGDCYCEKCKNIKGENNLGILTMEVCEFYYNKLPRIK